MYQKYNEDPSLHLHIHLANASETTCMQYFGVRRRMPHIVQNATVIEHLNGRPYYYIVTAIANVAHVVTKLPLFSVIKLMHDLYIIIDISSSLIKIAMTTTCLAFHGILLWQQFVSYKAIFLAVRRELMMMLYKIGFRR